MHGRQTRILKAKILRVTKRKSRVKTRNPNRPEKTPMTGLRITKRKTPMTGKALRILKMIPMTGKILMAKKRPM